MTPEEHLEARAEAKGSTVSTESAREPMSVCEVHRYAYTERCPRCVVVAEDLRELSLTLEAETGYDSIPTIEAMYDGRCVFPGCKTRSRDPEKLWVHVHFGRKHGLSFGKTLNKLLAEAS